MECRVWVAQIDVNVMRLNRKTSCVTFLFLSLCHTAIFFELFTSYKFCSPEPYYRPCDKSESQ